MLLRNGECAIRKERKIGFSRRTRAHSLQTCIPPVRIQSHLSPSLNSSHEFSINIKRSAIAGESCSLITVYRSKNINLRSRLHYPSSNTSETFSFQFLDKCENNIFFLPQRLRVRSFSSFRRNSTILLLYSIDIH